MNQLRTYLLTAIVLGIGTLAPESAQAALCNCYWDSDCGSGGDCTDYYGCTLIGKCDGTCKSGGEEELAFQALLSGRLPNREEVAEALELYFEAYLVAARKEDGPADPVLFARASNTHLGTQNRLIHEVLRNAVHEVLDTILGFDFAYPQPACLASTPAGNIRLAHEESVAFIDFMKRGFAQAVRDGDVEAVDTFLTRFWRQHPGFHPHHSGRYYPHGHSGETVRPIVVQRQALRLIFDRLRDLGI